MRLGEWDGVEDGLASRSSTTRSPPATAARRSARVSRSRARRRTSASTPTAVALLEAALAGRAIRPGRSRTTSTHSSGAPTRLAGRTRRRRRALRALPRRGRDADDPAARGALRDAAQLRAQRHRRASGARKRSSQHALGAARGHRGSVHARAALLVDGAPCARRGSRNRRADERPQGDRAARRRPRTHSTSPARTCSRRASRSRATTRTTAEGASRPAPSSCSGAAPAPRTSSRSRSAARAFAALQGERRDGCDLARAARSRSRRRAAGRPRARARALADGLALDRRDDGRPTRPTVTPVDMLEEQGRWRDATNACRSWGKMLRDERTRGTRRWTCSSAPPSSACAPRPPHARAER